ncbi:failed axon connections homolog [Littorina saxatilis]|uniref:Uncharacterized protein n=1 Tax=Littorina saxatilis TaxID=31220 RepID=A0AAN9GJJ4_9CAEN
MFAVFQQIAPLILAGLATLLLLYLFIRYKNSTPKKKVPKDTVLIYGVGRGVAAPSGSPFPLKLETFCRMANIPYMVDHSCKMSSKGKTPWMEYNGKAVADSQFCIEHLKEQGCLDLDNDLEPSLKAQARAFREMVEENLYWTMCHELFIMHPERVARAIPYSGVKLWLATLVLGRVIRKELWGHGMGRHSDTQIWDIARRDLQALSAFLGEKNYFCGEEPHEVDCAMFGMLAQLYYHMPDSRHEQYMKEYVPNLVDFVERMRERYWPDWHERCKGRNYVDDSCKLYLPKISSSNTP